MIDQLLLGLLFASGIAVVSYVARFLTLSGSLAQLVLGTVLFGLGGWQWTFPILVFFISSSLLSRFGRRRRASSELFFEKPSQRDAWQVIANGGLAGLTTIFWFLTQNDLLYIAHLGAITAATADTWATEIGTLSRSLPFLITSLKRVDSGRSGAISILGIISGVIGSSIIWLSSLPFISPSELIPILSALLLGGSLASLTDSLLGATVQRQFLCPVCGKVIEGPQHCGIQSKPARGFAWLKNDQVNLICTVSGSFFAIFIFWLISF